MGSKRQDSSATEWREFRLVAEEPPRVIPLGRPIPPEARVVREEARSARPLAGLVGEPPPQFASSNSNSNHLTSKPSSYHPGSHHQSAHQSGSYQVASYQSDPYRIPQHSEPYPLHPKPLIEARRGQPTPSYYPTVYQEQRSLESRYGIPAIPDYLPEKRPSRNFLPSSLPEISPFRLAAGLLFFVSSIFLAVTLATLIDLSLKRSSSEGAGRATFVVGR